jgi:Bacteriocin-protection, YdeI or OmpD-Associated/Domain of unknown function (DUF1905)
MPPTFRQINRSLRAARSSLGLRKVASMPKNFRGVLQGVEDSSGTYVLVPASIMKSFGGRIRVPVRMTINGVEHRTTICNMGLGPALGVPGAMRVAARVERGDRITVAIEEDTAKRTVAVPADLRREMTAPERKTFDGLAFSHRKEYVLWVEDAKKLETRARRIEQVRAKLRERL